MKMLVLSLLLTFHPKPQPKIVEVCRVVTVQNQVACHKVVTGVFPTNSNWLKKGR